MSSTQHYQLSTTGVENEPATNVVRLGLQERLGCVLYDAEFDDVFRSWWNTTEYGSRCQLGDKDCPNSHLGLKNRRAVAWSEMYEAADNATGKPLVFVRGARSSWRIQIIITRVRALSAPISNQSPVEEALPTSDFLIERVKAPGK